MCQNKKDSPEKLQIVIITRKRVVSNSVLRVMIRPFF